MKNKYRRYFPFSCLLVLLIQFSFAQSKAPANLLSGKTGVFFLENKGQCLSLEEKKPLENLLFHIPSPKGDLYITTSGISYVFSIPKNKPDLHSDSLRNLQLKQTTVQKNAAEMHYEIERVDLTLENASIRKSKTEIFYSADTGSIHYLLNRDKSFRLGKIEKLIIRDIYPGIDWLLSIVTDGPHATLKQDFILNPGADTRSLSFRYSGNARIDVDSIGGLLIKSRMGEISEAAPIVFEEGTNKLIPVRVLRKNNRLSYGFAERFIQKRTIVDPDLFWGTAITSDLVGINYNDQVAGNDLCTDANGNIYVLATISKGVSFPTRNPGNGAYYKDFASTPNGAMNIMKFNKNGVLLWSSFFGDGTQGASITVDPAGNLYAAGNSNYDNIPLLDNGGYYDGTSRRYFISKFSAAGQLLWSTYFGDLDMVIHQLLCDSKGNLYVDGVSSPLYIPRKDPGGGAYQYFGGTGPFISEFSPAGSLIWSTLINATNYHSVPLRMTVDPSDNLYMTADMVHMFNTNHQETWTDATVAWPFLKDITSDRQGNIYVVGYGPSTIIKTDPGNGAFIDNTINPGWSTAYIIKYNPAHQIVWSTPFFNETMTNIFRIVADQKCDAVHLVGVMNTAAYAVPTMNNTCNGGFYFDPSRIVTTYAPLFVTFKTSGKRIYTSLSNFTYNYYDQGLGFASDPEGGLIYLFGHIFNYSNIPAVKDPGGGAFVHTGTNNLSYSAFLMKLVPSKMEATLAVNTPSGCNCNGSASVNVICGTAPYVYNWSNGATTASVNGLCSGKYTVTVTDDNCNDTSFSFDVPPAPGSITGFMSSATPAHCNQGDGTIQVASVSGGTGPYQYHINSLPSQNNGNFTGLVPGRYLMTVNDINGCSFKDSVTVTNAPGPDLIYSKTAAASCNLNDGMIQVDSIRNGMSPFDYRLNGNSFGPATAFNNLASGKYYLQVRDAAGCLFGDSIMVMPSLPPVTAQISASPAHCNLKDGKLNIISVSGGLAPFAYSIDGSNYQSASSFNTLLSGTYQIYIRDSKNCVLQVGADITSVAAPSGKTLKIKNADCDALYGQVEIVTVSGGTKPFVYSMDSIYFQSSVLFGSLQPGNYQLFIKDSAGCLYKDGFSIISSTTTPVKIFPRDSTVCYGEKIHFILSTGSGPAPKNYNWNNGSGSSAEFDTRIDKTGQIIVSLTNASNCSSADTAFINIKNCDSTAETCVHFPNAFTPNNDQVNDQFGALAHCAVTNFKLDIYNRYGQRVFAGNDISKKWNGTIDGMPLNAGNYVYICEYSIGPVRKVKKGFVILVR